MKVNKEDMLLYVVTDRTWLGTDRLADQVRKIAAAGATFLQLREKDLSFDEFVKEAEEIKAIAAEYHIPFVINDNIEVALAVDADGVHLGQGDEQISIAREKLGFDKIIGLSAHTVEEALSAEKCGADYIGVGAVFQTSTKADANVVSLSTVKEICNAVKIPVVAIGGITKENMIELSRCGLDGVAVVSAIFAQPDLIMATKELLQLAKNMVWFTL